MTATMIARIVGDPDGDGGTGQLLRAADAAAVAHLEAERGVMIDADEKNELYHTFETIAEQCDDQGFIEQAKADLLRLPALGTPKDDDYVEADAVACARWRPEIDAAYYFGLALGLRLAACENGGVR